MIVRDVPFSEFTFMIVSVLVLMPVCVVYSALSYYAAVVVDVCALPRDVDVVS